MHLLSNVIKAMQRHYTGQFSMTKSAPGAPPSQQNVQPAAARRNVQRRPTDVLGDATQPDPNEVFGESDSDDDEDPPPPQEEDGEEYVISDQEWERICADQELSRKRFPPSIGNVVPITSGRLTTADWFTWGLHQAPIYLQGRLPEVHFKGYILLARAIKLTLQKQFSNDEMDELELLFKAFSKYYEENIYCLRYSRLHACLPVFHAILHIAEYTRRLGPLYASSQFPMERIIRIIKAMLKSMSRPNENCANRMADNECLNLLSFVAPLPPGVGRGFHNLLETDQFSDREGKFDIGKLFQFAMREDLDIFNDEENAPWPVLHVDEPWIPDGFQYAPRRGRPLPVYDSDEDEDMNDAEENQQNDDSSDDEEGHNEINTSLVEQNMALKNMTEDPPFTVREQNAIISYFRTYCILPDRLDNPTTTSKELRDFLETLDPIKYKTLVSAGVPTNFWHMGTVTN